LDQCSETELKNLFSPIVDLPNTNTKAEIINPCLNNELAGYGFNSCLSPDKTSVLINDETMRKVIDFLNDKGYQPYITQEQINRIRIIQKVSTDNSVDIVWAQSSIRKKDYYFKQYGFNGAQLILISR